MIQNCIQSFGTQENFYIIGSNRLTVMFFVKAKNNKDNKIETDVRFEW
jgi:hypothetical protein